jgi:hypothetical protein
MKYYRLQPNAFPATYLHDLRGEILASPYFTVNNLNRDFVGTKGFSVVFRRSHLGQVERQFPFFKLYLEQALDPDCNAFYLNPLWLTDRSRVDPHVDRSLRSYCKTIAPPLLVSVLYIQVSADLAGGQLILRNHKQQVASISPQLNTLLWFQGDLTHSVNAVEGTGMRLSLVCEQYELGGAELQLIPEFTIESRLVLSKPSLRQRQ